jgi:hypothetical protein
MCCVRDPPHACAKVHTCTASSWSQVQSSLLANSNQMLGRTHDALAHVYTTLGDAASAVKHAKAACETVYRSFGPASVQASHQMLLLAQALRLAGQADVATRIEAAAQETLTVFDNAEVSERRA